MNRSPNMHMTPNIKHYKDKKKTQIHQTNTSILHAAKTATKNHLPLAMAWSGLLSRHSVWCFRWSPNWHSSVENFGSGFCWASLLGWIKKPQRETWQKLFQEVWTGDIFLLIQLRVKAGSENKFGLHRNSDYWEQWITLEVYQFGSPKIG